MLDVRHWLPIHLRIAYRIAALVWRCLLGLAPSYFFFILRTYCHHRTFALAATGYNEQGSPPHKEIVPPHKGGTQLVAWPS